MAIQNSAKQNMADGSDSEDGPVVFKRSSTTKQNQLNSEVKKPSSQRCDSQSGRQNSDVSSVNGLNSQKGKGGPSTKASPAKSPTASPKASISSVKASAIKSPVSKESERSKSTIVKEERNSFKQSAKSNCDSEDSEDDKPLSSRLKGGTNNADKGLGHPTSGSSWPPVLKTTVKTSSEDSDDEPLSSRFQMKSNVTMPGGKLYDSDEKPLASRIQQNGSNMADKQKKPVISTKRPLDKDNSSGQSLAKKPKIIDSSSLKNKQLSVKAEPKADDDDYIPISERIKKSTASNNKLSTSNKKVTKPVSSASKKIVKKSKIIVKNSKYSKSTKVLPSSGDGQKKWTTLVHNGVIFPPPYKPHGVKMLYNGKPVDLTPAQEEVATMFAVMKDTDYVQKQTFRDNFWNDWRKLLGKNHIIQKLDLCDFTPIYDWCQSEKEKKKQMTAEEKKALKEEKLNQEDKYMWAIVDGVKEKV